MRLRLLALPAAVLLAGCIAGCGSTAKHVSSTQKASAGASSSDSTSTTGSASTTAARSGGAAASPAASVGPRSLAGLETDKDDDDTQAGTLDTNRYDVDSDSDNDLKKEPKRYFDADDDLSSYGHAASPAQAHSAAALVRRYYRLLANGDGAAACSLMTPTVERVLPYDYGHQGPSYLRGATTCAAVLTRLAAHEHALLAEWRRMVVVGVRIAGTQGTVLIGGPNMPASSVLVLREHGGWAIGVLLGGPLS